MTIEISNELAKKIIAFCDDELNYHINESGCADEYADEIEAQIELLRLMGYSNMADKYARQFSQKMGDTGDLSYLVTIYEDEDEFADILEKLSDAGIDYELDLEPDSLFTNAEGVDFLRDLGVDMDYV